MSDSHLVLRFENLRLQEMKTWRYVVFDGNNREMQSGPLYSLCPLSGGIESYRKDWREALQEVDTLRKERDALRKALALPCRQTGCGEPCSCCAEKRTALSVDV